MKSFLIFCKRNFLFSLANAVYLINQVLQEVNEEVKVVVMYDIACVLIKHLKVNNSHFIKMYLFKKKFELLLITLCLHKAKYNCLVYFFHCRKEEVLFLIRTFHSAFHHFMCMVINQLVRYLLLKIK